MYASAPFHLRGKHLTFLSSLLYDDSFSHSSEFLISLNQQKHQTFLSV